MDTQPHVHQIEVNESDYVWPPLIKVKYGDTTVRMRKWFWRRESSYPRRIRKAAELAVKRHDEGTLKATRKANILSDSMLSVNREVAGLNLELVKDKRGFKRWGVNGEPIENTIHTDTWASEKLKAHQS